MAIYRFTLYIIALKTPYIFYLYTVAQVDKLAFIAQNLPVEIRSEKGNLKVVAKCSARDRGEEYDRNINYHSLYIFSPDKSGKSDVTFC